MQEALDAWRVCISALAAVVIVLQLALIGAAVRRGVGSSNRSTFLIFASYLALVVHAAAASAARIGARNVVWYGAPLLTVALILGVAFAVVTVLDLRRQA